MTGDDRCSKCGKRRLYGRHINSEKCGGMVKLILGPQDAIVSETEHTVTTRPAGVEPGKLSVTWPKQSPGWSTVPTFCRAPRKK